MFKSAICSMIFVGFAVMLGSATAQTVPPPDPESAEELGSISGVGKDDVGKPISGASISASGGPSPRTETTTDADGRYELDGLLPGRYRISMFVRQEPYEPSRRMISVSAGEELKSVNFRLERQAEIAGRVLDENNEPLPGMQVYVVGSAYQRGQLQHRFRMLTKTDDQGAYRLNNRLEAGVTYAILAKPVAGTIPAVSDVPADPTLRRPAFAPTYYPRAPSLDGAERLVLRSGEIREGVDIRMLRSPSHCIEGVLDLGGQPGVTYFRIQETEASFGTTPDGGMYGQTPSGKTGPDGRIRICDLARGEYRITASSPIDTTGEFFFGTSNVAITREDVTDFSMGAQPLLPLSGEIVWDAAAPEEPVESEIRVSLESLYRAMWPPERDGLLAKTTLPGEFAFPGLLMDEYQIRGLSLPENMYVKDITYGGASILHDALRLGSARGDARLRFVIGHDGAKLDVKVADEDGNPVTSVNVFIIPDGVLSEPQLADRMISGQLDQRGGYSSKALAPGKYYVLAGDVPLDFTPEAIGKLWRARPKAKEVQLEPNATEAITIEPTTMP